MENEAPSISSTGSNKKKLLVTVLGITFAVLLILGFIAFLFVSRGNLVSPLPESADNDNMRVIFVSPQPSASLMQSPSASASASPKTSSKATPRATPKASVKASPKSSSSPGTAPKVSVSPSSSPKASPSSSPTT